MMKNEYKVIGVMSGTSLDGVDLVYVTFQFNNTWKFKITCAETIAYNNERYETLKNLVVHSKDGLQQIDADYTMYLASVIKSFIKKHKITEIDAVCSHGHTALHQPHEKLTYQIGNMSHLATTINTRVVCDFRVQDVELGGQGAPLVPIGDELLFSDYDYCINLGGFANISTKIDNERIAFDISPANIVLNYYVKLLGFNYDDKGKIAASGKINQELLKEFNSLQFYSETYPKSLGLEWVNQNIFPLINSYKIEIKDVLKTFVEHIAIQIKKATSISNKSTIYITGGGAYNEFLVQRIKAHSECKVIIPSKDIIEFKEALIFGFLGVLKLRNEFNCLKSVTGASRNHSSGKVLLP